MQRQFCVTNITGVKYFFLLLSKTYYHLVSPSFTLTEVYKAS